MTAPTEIRFYRVNGPHGFLSNLFRRPVFFEGEQFDCRERAYQAGPGGKARKPDVRRWLLAAPTPALCAMAAHGLYHWDIRSGWSRDRRGRMRDVVEAFFRQHGDMAEQLLATDDARLVEAGTIDNEVNRRWGEVNGRGRNWLGLIHMDVRAVLRAERERGAVPTKVKHYTWIGDDCPPEWKRVGTIDVADPADVTTALDRGRRIGAIYDGMSWSVAEPCAADIYAERDEEGAD